MPAERGGVVVMSIPPITETPTNDPNSLTESVDKPTGEPTACGTATFPPLPPTQATGATATSASSALPTSRSDLDLPAAVFPSVAPLVPVAEPLASTPSTSLSRRPRSTDSTTSSSDSDTSSSSTAPSGNAEPTPPSGAYVVSIRTSG